MCIEYDPSYGSNYQCYQKVTYTNVSSGIAIDYCSIKQDNSLTWTQAQGACMSLNYSLAVIDTADKQLFM